MIPPVIYTPSNLITGEISEGNHRWKSLWERDITGVKITGGNHLDQL